MSRPPLQVKPSCRLIRRRQPAARQAQAGFTLVELLIIAAILILVSAIIFPMILKSNEEQKLRQAAIELQSWLVRARSLAQRGYGSCAVTPDTNAAGRLVVDSSASPTSTVCTSANLENLNLPALVSVRGFCLSSNGGSASSCTAPAGLVFNDLGLLAGSAQTLYLAGSATTAQYCVEVSLTLTRVGFRNGSSGACRFNLS